MFAQMPAHLTVRRAINADAPAVKELVWQVLREYGMEPDPGHADRGLDHIEDSFQGGGLWLVHDGDHLIGTVGLTAVNETVCELTKMFLAPAARGQGLGRKLLSGVINKARDLGFDEIELETDTSLIEAVGLYTSAGFEKVPCANQVSRCNMVMRLKL